MRGLRLSRGEKINCIKDYANLGAAVTESLMRKGIKNYDEAVSEGALSSGDQNKYFMKFNNAVPFTIYSTLWALDQDEMKSSDKGAGKRAEKHFNTLNDPEFILEAYFPEV